MSTGAAAPAADRVEQADRRIDLLRRFLQAGIGNPELLPRVPEDALLFLLPDDDAAFVEREIVEAAASARRGQNVYLHHVRVADLPELTPPTGPRLGDRRARYDLDGRMISHEILGPDGEWHPTDLPPLTPRDDDED